MDACVSGGLQLGLECVAWSMVSVDLKRSSSLQAKLQAWQAHAWCSRHGVWQHIYYYVLEQWLGACELHLEQPLMEEEWSKGLENWSMTWWRMEHFWRLV